LNLAGKCDKSGAMLLLLHLPWWKLPPEISSGGAFRDSGASFCSFDSRDGGRENPPGRELCRATAIGSAPLRPSVAQYSALFY
jgi:hypothetical protein